MGAEGTLTAYALRYLVADVAGVQVGEDEHVGAAFQRGAGGFVLGTNAAPLIVGAGLVVDT